MTKPPLPKPPKSLSATSQKLWVSIVADYELEVHHLSLLREALEQADRAEAARARIAAEGLTIVDRFGQTKAHPCCEIERQSALAFLRILRELGLDIEPPQATRGPRRPGTRN